MQRSSFDADLSHRAHSWSSRPCRSPVSRTHQKGTPCCRPRSSSVTARRRRLIDFAGWEMPVQYSGILDEHRAVASESGCSTSRTWARCGSQVRRPDAASRARWSPTLRRLARGRAHYSMICAPDGGIIDDLIVYRVAAERFLVVPNASNREVVVAELRRAPRPATTRPSTTLRHARR